MAIADRCLDEMQVEATGCRDRHQGVAARDAHRDRLENLAGIDAEGPGLGDRGVGLLVRDGLERDAVGFEMLRYLCHHPAPHLAGEPIITRIRPRGPWQLPARRGGRGRMIAGSLRPFTTRRHTTSRQREQNETEEQIRAGPDQGDTGVRQIGVGPIQTGRFLAVVATPDGFGVAMGRRGPGALPQVEKREQYARLIGQGFSSLEACRIVGINPRTGKRWRHGRMITARDGRKLHYDPVITRGAVVRREISDRYLSEKERVQIADLRAAGAGVRAIAERTGRRGSLGGRCPIAGSR